MTADIRTLLNTLPRCPITKRLRITRSSINTSISKTMVWEVALKER
jgi:hypothetical protein